MTVSQGSDLGLTALHQRLSEVAPELLPEPAALPDGDRGAVSAELLRALVAAVQSELSRDRMWLLLVAVAAVFPLDDEVRAAQRRLELSSVSDAVLWLLEWGYDVAHERESGAFALRLVRDGVVVDVDYTAKHDQQTGIQRVVRRLVPRWDRDHDIVLAVWTDHSGALRALDDDEQERVLRWVRPLHRASSRRGEPVVLVPWRSTLVLPEVPGRDQCARLASLAQHSGNRVTAVGHDTIPVVSADLMPEAEPSRFVRYLTLVKHAEALAGVSRSATEEFRGFVSGLPAQGLTGPRVEACPLATEPVAHDAGPLQGTAEPEVLVVGSHEPRKNHLAVLYAAEVLWREGTQFRLRLVGPAGWTTEALDRRLETLQAAGRPVTAERGLDDEQLWAAYRRARFTVFPSLHEGFGLPVVESLALGTPVIATDYGSIAELADDGGMVLVDPRDDAAITDAMRGLLLDDERLEQLRKAALERPVRTWDDYARELWQCLVERP
jgi:glycosyltransferase involved in cell wall biosynthesis